MKKKLMAGIVTILAAIILFLVGTGFHKRTDAVPGDRAGNEEVSGNDATEDETIIYNGKEYKKSELCNATLHWLGLTEEERLFSSYLPPEFLVFDENWGVTLTVENVTPINATIRCTQTGGEATGELQTGSWFIVERWTQENGWKEVDYSPELNGEIAWTAEAYMIPPEDVVEWKVSWEYLYGKLPAGKYRIGKEIMDFRGPGDYDTAIYFAEFEIK